MPKIVDEMMRVTTSFLKGEVAASNHEQKKSFPPWKQQEGNHKQNFKKGGFRNQQRPKRRQDRFTLLTETPIENFSLDKGKFKASPPMSTPVEKRNHAKFCKGSHKAFLLTQKSFFHPPLGEDKGTEGPIIIKAEIRGHCIHRMYVDVRSASKVLYEHCFNRLCLEIKNQLVPAKTPLIGFIDEIIWPIGKIQLLVKIRDEEHSTSAWMNFVVVRSPSPHNGIIGRPGFKKLQAVLSKAHGMLKLTVEGGVITQKSSKMVPLECVMVSGPEMNLSVTKQTIEERVKRNLDIFAWKPADMTGVPRHIVKHRLNVRSLVRQKKRGQAADRNHAMQGDWRMCVDFKDLNKACPKDGYPLPEIVWKVESLCGFPFKCFLDAYKEEGMFLGYKVSTRGCPNKVDVVLSLPSLKCLKDVQKLNGKLASLDRFLAKLAEKSLSFFKTLKKCTKKSDFHWTAKAKEAFKQMKKLITLLPMLVVPMKKEELIVYLAAAKETVSAVLRTERETKQMPIYFFSRALRGPEINYTSMEKLVLALVHAKDDSLDTLMKVEEELLEPRILFTDGPSRTDGFGAGLANVDSRLLANQVNKTYVAKESDMIRYLEKEIDIARPFSKGPRKVKFLIVAIDYFIKWIEAKPVATITGNQIKKLSETTLNGDTPFSLTYRTKAVIPAEIGMPTLRTAEVDIVQNNEALEINLDLL
uniref:Reverse transcriptase domain-containing protein n=1 Tax=Tanacetum cinerariifolium TaxID=118510 RepID=A0A699HGL7_TANCI|nr:reverse transcriptase domain-containing protein [Tanacetum cinerariifolium]